MKLTDKTIIRIIGVAVGVVAVAGTAYAVTSTIPDRPDETSTTIITTTEQAPTTEVSVTGKGDAGAVAPESTTATLTTKQETTVDITTTEAPREITFEYDAVLTRELGELIQSRSTIGAIYQPSDTFRAHPENFIHGTEVGTTDGSYGYVGAVPNNGSAQDILDVWTNFAPMFVNQSPPHFNVEVYRYSNGYYHVVIN